MTLTEAIQAVQSSQTALATSDATKVAAQSAFDAAQIELNTATAANTAAKVAYNNALDSLIAAATAAKRP